MGVGVGDKDLTLVWPKKLRRRSLQVLYQLTKIFIKGNVAILVLVHTVENLTNVDNLRVIKTLWMEEGLELFLRQRVAVVLVSGRPPDLVSRHLLLFSLCDIFQ